MKTILIIVQIIISISLITLILLQAKGSGLGSAFGGDAGFYRSKRGVEKLFVYLTVILVVLFFLVSALQVII
ncbi:preprotein translocase subunit SecG [Candidatus Curtissbacteria bacterium RIFCSPLOWO2_01_FULL_42_26]|uniref:Protein-export membrane protein SecG n=1 Tax=Candidatus Curtissbacteria bacterium RIFCSPLOWO2_01_FULL_42_26 TaxID=1797729 RepID=A0A1F5I3A1_9BACT|nr:MAG: preprotein translocase subunit SecG [Candidatus Curtissbacteria bacterium RIFCSPLOWO2_01_FULL_42_26]